MRWARRVQRACRARRAPKAPRWRRRHAEDARGGYTAERPPRARAEGPRRVHRRGHGSAAAPA
eukprot:7004707-Prymnesium_polylepis.2